MNSNNITRCFNTVLYTPEEDEKVMRWLSPQEPGIRHQDVRDRRLEGSGDWFLETSEFREWRGGEPGAGEGGAGEAVLFCSGNPGVGKTFLR